MWKAARHAVFAHAIETIRRDGGFSNARDSALHMFGASACDNVSPCLLTDEHQPLEELSFFSKGHAERPFASTIKGESPEKSIP